MGVYVAKRLLMIVPVLFGVAVVVFFVMHAAPGDPAEIMAGPAASPDVVANIREQLGLNEPLHVQFLQFCLRLVRGDLGKSLMTGRMVVDDLARTFPPTVELALLGGAWSVLLAVPLGVTAAVHRNSAYDKVGMTLSVVGVALPVFWIALMLVWLFGVKLGWLPISGRAGPLWTWEGFRSIVLPAVSLGSWQIAAVAKLTRTAMLEVLNEDYIRTAWAKGLSHSLVVYKHALKNALLPVITVVGLQFGLMLGGAVVTETVFSWPGMGRLVVSAILNRDFPLAQGCILLFALTFMLINLVVDCIYVWVDPRVRYA